MKHPEASAALKNGAGHSVVVASSSTITGDDNYNGFQNSVLHTAKWKGWQFNNQFIITDFNTLNDNGIFLRPVIDLSKPFVKINNWRIGFRYAP